MIKEVLLGKSLSIYFYTFYIAGIPEPWKRPSIAKIVIEALEACPDQIRPYMVKILQPLWTPRHSESWFQVVDFLYSIMESLDVNKIIVELGKEGNNINIKLFANVISNFCCNEKIFKEVICEAIHVNDKLVQLKGIELQGLLLQKINHVLNNDEVSATSKKQILFRLQNKIPSLNDILAIWNLEILEPTLTSHVDDTNDATNTK